MIKYLTRKITNVSIEKKNIVKKNIQKKKKKITPQHFCVAEDCMLLEGGVLYGFTGGQLGWIFYTRASVVLEIKKKMKQNTYNKEEKKNNTHCRQGIELS